MSHQIAYTKAALKDIPKLMTAHLDGKTKNLIALLRENPYQTPPTYEKLVGDLSGAYSRRINIQQCLVYQVYEDQYIVKIISLWSLYERSRKSILKKYSENHRAVKQAIKHQF